MKCPQCHKEGAKFSTYYPDLIVHKCNGQKLIEVGSRQQLEKEESDQFLKTLKVSRSFGFANIDQSSYPTDYDESKIK